MGKNAVVCSAWHGMLAGMGAWGKFKRLSKKKVKAEGLGRWGYDVYKVPVPSSQHGSHAGQAGGRTGPAQEGGRLQEKWFMSAPTNSLSVCRTSLQPLGNRYTETRRLKQCLQYNLRQKKEKPPPAQAGAAVPPVPLPSLGKGVGGKL